MYCIEIAAPGGPDQLRWTERPQPQPAAEEVLIRVLAAGINRPDILQRKGYYPPPPGASDLPGLEVAGEVVAVGAQVARWRVGDLVCALLTGGGYAEYVVADGRCCLPIPDGMPPAVAAALPETYFTVWSNVFQRGRLQPGEWLLVQGGSSGIGTTAIQLARAFGAEVVATAGSAEKCRTCLDLGAAVAVNYRTEDFVEAVHQATAGRGVDVVLDMVAGDTLPRELAALAEEGRLLVIAFQGGARATIDVADVMRRRLTVTGSTLRARSAAFKAEVAAELEQRVWPLLAAGRVRPVIGARFPLRAAAAAHGCLEAGKNIGKILLDVADV